MKNSKLYSNSIVFALMVGIGAVGTANHAFAENKKSPFKAKASVGIEYDSNISVEELDANTTRSDHAVLLDLDLGYKKRLTNELDVGIGYSLSQSLYDELDQFDIQTHMLSGNLKYDFGHTSAGVNYYYADSTLDRDDYLTLSQINPFLSHYFTKKWFGRAAYSYSDKKFDGRADRDAQVDAYSGDLYYFIEGAKHYLMVGYKFRQDDAESARFDYDGHQFKLRWVKRLSLMERESKLRMGYVYERRDYDDISSAGMEQRQDDRQRWSADLEFPVYQQGFVRLEYEYSDYDSNIDSLTYTQHIAGLRIGYRF